MHRRPSCDGALVSRPTIVIAGAGSIGCYVGGCLSLAGHKVRFLGRPRIMAAVAEGLHLTDYAGLDVTVKPDMTDDPAVLSGADMVLVAVKSGATAEMADHIAAHAPTATVVSLQNGVTNAAVLRDALPNATVLAAMVPFNVVPLTSAHYHRGTSGAIMVEAGDLPDLSTTHLRWEQTEDIAGIQWGKLLINLGNAINALSDLPLKDMLQDRAWRRLMADQMAEALRVLRAAGIKPAKTTGAPPALIPHILRLPTPLFRRIAASMLTIDPKARSSMWDDLTQRRPTEIDALQGVIIEMGKKHGVETPLNQRMYDLIKAAETARNGPPGIEPGDVRHAA